MEKLSGLAKIRELYKNNSAQPIQPPIYCPLCTHALTVEITEYFESRICENCFEHAVIISHDGCCLKPELQPVKFITSGNTIQVRSQCKNCGKLYPTSQGGFTKEQREKLPLCDLTARDNFQNKISNAWTESFQKKKVGQQKLFALRKDDWFERYSKYLQSPEWRDKRDLVLKRDNKLCQACLKSYATQVHHRSYEFVDMTGSEPAFDLIAVCGPCHDKIEEMKKINRAKSMQK